MKRHTPFALLIAAVIALLIASPLRAQDAKIDRHVPVTCPSGQFAYYNASAALWYCTATGPKVAEGGATQTSSTALAAASVTDSSTTTSGTTQNTEYTLNAVTLPANAFNANTRGIRCVTWGTGASNSNAKNYKFYFGGTAVATLTGTTDSAKAYVADLTVVRTGSNTQSGVAAITSDVGAPDALAATSGLAQTDTGPIVIAFKSANTAAAAASATGKGMVCTFLN